MRRELCTSQNKINTFSDNMYVLNIILTRPTYPCLALLPLTFLCYHPTTFWNCFAIYWRYFPGFFLRKAPSSSNVAPPKYMYTRKRDVHGNEWDNFWGKLTGGSWCHAMIAIIWISGEFSGNFLRLLTWSQLLDKFLQQSFIFSAKIIGYIVSLGELKLSFSRILRLFFARLPSLLSLSLRLHDQYSPRN